MRRKEARSPPVEGEEDRLAEGKHVVAARPEQQRSQRRLQWRVPSPLPLGLAAGVVVAVAVLLWLSARLTTPPPSTHITASPAHEHASESISRSGPAPPACPPCKCPSGVGDEQKEQQAQQQTQTQQMQDGSSAQQCTCTMGGVPCAHTEYARTKLLVLAAHGEDTSWAHNAGTSVPIAVYTNHNDTSRPIAAGVASGRGKEARTYLAAILDRWDDLPDAIAYMHAHRDSWHNFLGDVHTNSEWRLKNLRWPINENYVDLTCREPGADFGVLRTDLASPSIGRDIRVGWEEHFKHYLGLHPPKLIVTPCCAQFLVTRRAIQKLPREFYEETIKWLDTTQVSAPEYVLEYLWQVMFSKRHRGTYAWAFLPQTCSCYLYGLGCSDPTALFHLNPAEPPQLPW